MLRAVRLASRGCSDLLATNFLSAISTLCLVAAVVRKYFQNASAVVRDIIEGLAYLHSMGIVHRDIKPENILCTKNMWPLNVKLTDFGLSNTISAKQQSLTTQVGTPHFAAPELLKNQVRERQTNYPLGAGCSVRKRAHLGCSQTLHAVPFFSLSPSLFLFATLRQKYGFAVDMWAVGIVLYNMLSGELPFDDDYDAGTIFRKILTIEPEFPESRWKDISVEAVRYSYSHKITKHATEKVKGKKEQRTKMKNQRSIRRI